MFSLSRLSSRSYISHAHVIVGQLTSTPNPWVIHSGVDPKRKDTISTDASSNRVTRDASGSASAELTYQLAWERYYLIRRLKHD